MWKKIILGLVVFIALAGSLLWINRIDFLLYLAGNKNKEPVAVNREIVWQQGPAQPSDKPNVVLILTDDMGINDVSTFGAGMIDTPNIDKLAAKGALFTNGYSGHANCAPSRAALLTGRDATRTGFDITPIPNGFGRMVAMIENADLKGRPAGEYFPEVDASNPDYEDRGLNSSEITIPELMKEQGYHTVHIGKWHLGQTNGMAPNDQGFDESLMMKSGLYLPVDHPEAVNGPIEFSGLDRFIWASMDYAVTWNGSQPFAPKGYLTDYFTEQAERAIEANANRPFFLYLAHWGPHNPIQAKKSDYEAVGDIKPHRKRVYAAMLRSLDRSVAKVMAKLEEQGIADNTIVVLSSDNGGADYVAIDDLNKPYRGWKNTFFEGGIRVPFSIAWPKQIKAGTVIDEPVNHFDLMPTIVNASQGKLPTDRELDGVDLAPLWQGSNKFVRKDDAMYWFTGTYRVVQADGWKLQLNPSSDQVFLFDLNSDPTEQTNLAATQPQKLDSLIKLIEQHFENAVPSAGYSVFSMAITIDKHLGEEMREGDTYIRWNN
ncbi:sulfatase-like hydrolase/transferase [uncultured Paraglaciecola sp.]|uniref:sulfatase-like hydrolase/transferase n=1 Tax=uncultured Paraglaciecola sp. TaxID=1765024 RepID=UPI00261B8F6E|nr:sulfatase-like hydrolase/transferase [uncultured Paraglaciecola sp.]